MHRLVAALLLLLPTVACAEKAKPSAGPFDAAPDDHGAVSFELKGDERTGELLAAIRNAWMAGAREVWIEQKSPRIAVAFTPPRTVGEPACGEGRFVANPVAIERGDDSEGPIIVLDWTTEGVIVGGPGGRLPGPDPKQPRWPSESAEFAKKLSIVRAMHPGQPLAIVPSEELAVARWLGVLLAERPDRPAQPLVLATRACPLVDPEQAESFEVAGRSSAPRKRAPQPDPIVTFDDELLRELQSATTEIRAAIDGRALQRCWEATLKKEYRGRLVLQARVSLTRAGAVERVEVTSEGEPDGRMERCVAGAIRRMSFPKQDEDGVTFKLPLTFQP